MPRTSRAIVAGHCYHVINRGNNRGRVFHESADYVGFLSLMRQAQEHVEMPLLAACLMPNHIHLVVKPIGDDDLSKWTHWLFTTHVNHYHRKHGTSGRVWQGRFKAFVVEEDAHLLGVLRYVERNALRAGLVDRAESWLWGSLRWRTVDPSPMPLQQPPAPLPRDWTRYVNEAQTADETDAIRVSVNRQRPYGSCDWVKAKAQAMGLQQSLTRRGRPPRRHT